MTQKSFILSLCFLHLVTQSASAGSFIPISPIPLFRISIALNTNPTATINYDYNNIYELTAVTGAQSNLFDYDSVGNREVAVGVTYTPNSLNQYANVGGQTYTYDNNGNLTSDGTNTYTYDELNRLTSVIASGSEAIYNYDAFNRRVSKTVNGVTTYFIYDNNNRGRSPFDSQHAIFHFNNKGRSLIQKFHCTLAESFDK